MNCTFYLMLKVLFVIKIFTFLSLVYCHAEKNFDKEAMVNFKVYVVKNSTANNHDIHITQYFKKQKQSGK